MKKLLIGMILGAAAGMAVAEIPAVNKAIGRGKKKMKDIVK